jgi:hypothetical protein
MPAKCKNNPRRTQHTRRSFQQRPDHRVMPHKIVHRAWLPDGNQVAVARINDLYIVQRFDASERPVGTASRFTGGHAATQAVNYAHRMTRL